MASAPDLGTGGKGGSGFTTSKSEPSSRHTGSRLAHDTGSLAEFGENLAPDSRARILDGSEARTGRRPTYVCSACKLIQRGAEGKHGDQCSFCQVGTLRVVARVTARMIRESKRVNG
jgi:hypothetical protein